MINVCAFTGGKKVPSARFRVRQYILPLKKEQVFIDEFFTRFNCYPPRNSVLRPFWASGLLLSQIPNIVRSYTYNVTILQRELLSTFNTFEGVTRGPRILDIDDAVFLNKDGFYIKKIASFCDLIVCGNQFIASFFDEFHGNVQLLPTAVNTDLYNPNSSENKKLNNDIIIGWIGTSVNLSYLYKLEAVFKKIFKLFKNVKLLVVCNKQPTFNSIDSSNIIYLPWSEANEVKCIQKMDIGIMPLDNSEWCMGKCSFKMLQYMSCGVPVVVSPVGMNNEVMSFGFSGFLADDKQQWFTCLSDLIESKVLRSQLGVTGRQVVNDFYSLKVLSPKFASHIKSVL